MRLRLIHFFLALVWLGASAAGDANAQGEPRVALVIGNANYPDAESPLKDTLTYARSMADELKRSGFEVDLGENLTKEAMRTAIDRFYGKIKQGSAALFFFSGFGIQSDRQTYVIPVNAQIWTEADVRRDGFSLDSILAIISVILLPFLEIVCTWKFILESLQVVRIEFNGLEELCFLCRNWKQATSRIMSSHNRVAQNLVG